MFARLAPLVAVVALAAGEPTRLSATLDAMDVEHHWLAGTHVDWRTGEPDRGRPDKTHCSAFVAAACERLGIYILRPPDHGQVHLASAQALWLESEGANRGWKPVASPWEAQELANAGNVVVAVFPSPDPAKAGHAALVRPSSKSAARVASEGPQVIQAGAENAASISLEKGFRHHRGAWSSARDFQVRFFTHALN